MKCHLGTMTNPVDLVTHAAGTTFVDEHGNAQSDCKPRDVTRKVRRLWGVSTRRWFVGVMHYEVTKR